LALIAGGLLLADNERTLQRAEGMSERLADELRAEPERPWEDWLEPWLDAWLNAQGIKPDTPRTVRNITDVHINRYAALSTHDNVVYQRRIDKENKRATRELSELIAPEEASALLRDLHNAWGRQFQGLSVSEPGG
ncbi:MAG: hypothetical protein ACI8S6_004324, partial [Myxococcota bacterium]